MLVRAMRHRLLKSLTERGSPTIPRRIRLALALLVTLAVPVAPTNGTLIWRSDRLPIVGQAAPNTNAPCPTEPVPVLAVENFYANLVQQLGGQCVVITTILSDPDADPHEFQLTANDVRAFQSTALVVENGLGYDDFADKALATMSRQPTVVRAGDVLGLQVGANPHVWYSAGYVDQINDAILNGLKQVAPDASAYFDAQAAALQQGFSTYHSLIDQISRQFAQTPVGATESIFVDMAYATNLKLITPMAFMVAISEGEEPSARDIATFQDQLRGKQVKVLVYNVQTATPTTEQLKSLAVQAGIPIVGVSETMPPDAETFQDWQATQLQLLLNALQKASVS